MEAYFLRIKKESWLKIKKNSRYTGNDKHLNIDAELQKHHVYQTQACQRQRTLPNTISDSLSFGLLTVITHPFCWISAKQVWMNGKIKWPQCR
jgi:hypothetical protein